MYLDINGLPIEKSTVFEGYDTYTSEFNNRDPRMTQTFFIPGTVYPRTQYPDGVKTGRILQTGILALDKYARNGHLLIILVIRVVLMLALTSVIVLFVMPKFYLFMPRQNMNVMVLLVMMT